MSRNILSAAAISAASILSGCESGSTSLSSDIANSGVDSFAYRPYATSDGAIRLIDPTDPAAAPRLVAGPTGAEAPPARVVPFGNYSGLIGGLERTQDQTLLILDEGRLFSVSLNNREIDKRQLSNASALCAFRQQSINHVLRNDSRAIMLSGGPDGDCRTRDDNQLVAIRFAASSDETPTLLSAAFAFRNATYDSNGQQRAVVVSDIVEGRAVLSAYTTDLTRSEPFFDVAQTGAARDVFAGDVFGLRQSFMRLRPLGASVDQLVVVRDGAEGFSVSRVADFDSPQVGNLLSTMVVDATAAFFLDGRALFRVDLNDLAAGATALYVAPARFDILGIRLTGNHVVLDQLSNDDSDLVRLVSVPKAGGASIELDAVVGGALAVQAAGPRFVFYTVRTEANVREARAVSADGAERRVVSGARFGGQQLLSGLAIPDASAGASSPSASVLVKVSDMDLNVAVRAVYVFMIKFEGDMARVFAIDVEQGLPGIELGSVAGGLAVLGNGLGASALLQIAVSREDGSSDADLFLADVTRPGSLVPVAATAGLGETRL